MRSFYPTPSPRSKENRHPLSGMAVGWARTPLVLDARVRPLLFVVNRKRTVRAYVAVLTETQAAVEADSHYISLRESPWTVKQEAPLTGGIPISRADSGVVVDLRNTDSDGITS